MPHQWPEHGHANNPNTPARQLRQTTLRGQAVGTLIECLRRKEAQRAKPQGVAGKAATTLVLHSLKPELSDFSK